MKNYAPPHCCWPVPWCKPHCFYRTHLLKTLESKYKGVQELRSMLQPNAYISHSKSLSTPSFLLLILFILNVESQWDRDFLSTDSFPKYPQDFGIGQAEVRSQESNPDTLHGWKGPKHLNQNLLLAKLHISRKLRLGVEPRHRIPHRVLPATPSAFSLVCF